MCLGGIHLVVTSTLASRVVKTFRLYHLRVNSCRNVIIRRSSSTFGIVLIRTCVVLFLLITPFLSVLATMLLALRIARVGLLIVAVVEGLEILALVFEELKHFM